MQENLSKQWYFDLNNSWLLNCASNVFLEIRICIQSMTDNLIGVDYKILISVDKLKNNSIILFY